MYKCSIGQCTSLFPHAKVRFESPLYHYSKLLLSIFDPKESYQVVHSHRLKDRSLALMGNASGEESDGRIRKLTKAVQDLSMEERSKNEENSNHPQQQQQQQQQQQRQVTSSSSSNPGEQSQITQSFNNTRLGRAHSPRMDPQCPHCYGLGIQPPYKHGGEPEVCGPCHGQGYI